MATNISFSQIHFVIYVYHIKQHTSCTYWIGLITHPYVGPLYAKKHAFSWLVLITYDYSVYHFKLAIMLMRILLGPLSMLFGKPNLAKHLGTWA